MSLIHNSLKITVRGFDLVMKSHIPDLHRLHEFQTVSTIYCLTSITQILYRF